MGLVFLGRLEEARAAAAHATRVAEASGELEVLVWINFASICRAYALGEAGSALEEGRRAVEIAEKLDNEVSRVYGYFALGMAYLIDGQCTAAREALHKSAATARDRRVVLSWLPWIVALLAQAHLTLGERTEALAAATRRH